MSYSLGEEVVVTKKVDRGLSLVNCKGIVTYISHRKNGKLYIVKITDEGAKDFFGSDEEITIIENREDQKIESYTQWYREKRLKHILDV